ncbi:hypothetical protein, partial [uncultured Dokdonia sp.]|uniref:hypothetical protein n=1 Tax=uncultured Dokdonia sp. TaxID=575653 RepID=UPI00263977A2
LPYDPFVLCLCDGACTGGCVILKRSHTIAVMTKYATAFCVAYFVVVCEPLGQSAATVWYMKISGFYTLTFQFVTDLNFIIYLSFKH